MNSKKNKSWKRRISAFILGLLVLPAVLMLQSLMSTAVYMISGKAPSLEVNAVPITLVLIVIVGSWYRFETGRKICPFQTFGRLGKDTISLIEIGIGAQGISTLMMIAIQILLPKAMETYEELLGTSGMGTMSLPIIVYTILLAPVVEELIFRGIILHYFEKAGCTFWIANILQAVLFGIYHLNLAQGICAGMIGILIGYVARKYNALTVGIFLHMIFNMWGYLLMTLGDAGRLSGVVFLLEIVFVVHGLDGIKNGNVKKLLN